MTLQPGPAITRTNDTPTVLNGLNGGTTNTTTIATTVATGLVIHTDIGSSPFTRTHSGCDRTTTTIAYDDLATVLPWSGNGKGDQ